MCLYQCSLIGFFFLISTLPNSFGFETILVASCGPFFSLFFVLLHIPSLFSMKGFLPKEKKN